MSWGISENATDKEKFWADINDTLKGFNSTAKIDYVTYCELYDDLRKQFDIWVHSEFVQEASS